MRYISDRKTSKPVKCLANVATVSDDTWRFAGREFQTTALETAQSLAPTTVLVCTEFAII